MRLSEFILLNEDEKKSTVFHQGVALAKRSSFDSIVFLFQLGSYYVEAYCNPANKEIEEYRMFDNIDVLNPYLEAISIDSLLSWMYVLFLRYPVPCNGIVYMDRLTNQSRGFGFIEMPDEEASKKAIAELDGATVLVYLSWLN